MQDLVRHICNLDGRLLQYGTVCCVDWGLTGNAADDLQAQRGYRIRSMERTSELASVIYAGH